MPLFGKQLLRAVLISLAHTIVWCAGYIENTMRKSAAKQ